MLDLITKTNYDSVLYQDCQMHWTATTADTATSAVEEGDANTMSLAHLNHFFLSFVELPCRTQPPSILTGVTIPDHDLLVAIMMIYQVFL